MAEYKKICPTCHKEFYTANKRKIYCTTQCDIIEQNRRKKGMEKEKRAAKPSKPLYTRICPYCYEEFTTEQKNKRYCTPHHAYLMQQKNKKAKEDNARLTEVRCKNPLCGKIFKQKTFGQKYCCAECVAIDGEDSTYITKWRNLDHLEKEKKLRKKAQSKKERKEIIPVKILPD